MPLTSPSEIKELMNRYDLHFTKRFGQNFLTDANIVRNIADAANIDSDDVVIEIGPGIGTLTQELAKQAGEVKTIEIDRKLIPVLNETLSDFDNVEIINEDFLKLNINDLLNDAISENKTIRIAANLPYYITTPIIMSLLESDLPIESMTFLIQKEVADRMASEPGNKIYGSLSVICQYYADVKKNFDVPASVFMPKPKVDSALVTLTKKEPELGKDIKKEDYFRVVKAAFANRRKTLLNTLFTNLDFTKDEITKALESIDISPSTRAEKLSGKDFERITEALFSQK